MSTYRWIRASDEDREEAAAVLGDAFVVGRLTHDELDERCAAVYAATTWGELDDLTADLPGALPVVRAEGLPYGTVAPRDVQRPDYPHPFWPLMAFALVMGAILASVADSAIAWTAVVLIPLTLLLPLALGSVRRRRQRR